MSYHLFLSGILCILILCSGCTAFEKAGSLSDSASLSGESVSPDNYAPAPTMGSAIPDTGAYRAKSAQNAVDKSESMDTIDQKIIKTSTLHLEVGDVQKTAEEIARISEADGGTIQSSTVNADQNDRYSGTVIIRIPADRFQIALVNLKSLGKLTSESISAEDITEEYVDLVAQKTALTNQLEQYNRILAKAVNVSEILEVQREIERVQVELDRITGRMKYLDNRVSLSTITVRLSEPAQVVSASGYSFASVINEGITGFTETLVWLIVFIMTLLPLVLIGGIGYILYKRYQRTRSG